MPTTYDMRDTLADMPDAARDYLMDLLRLGSDDGPQGGDADSGDYPDPADYGLSEAECQRYVGEALPRIVQTVGGPGYHVSPPPAGASYQQVVEHYTTQVQQIAGKYSVQIENPQIGGVEKAPTHQSVSATIETKSGWEPLVHFLYDVQQPDGFIVFENVNLLIDSGDPTIMRGRFKIAKWFKSAGANK